MISEARYDLGIKEWGRGAAVWRSGEEAIPGKALLSKCRA